MDYFGARYYDHNSYRFISTDPIINKEEALSNTQLWNLYAYCRSNTITYLDPDGRISESMGKYEYTFAENLGKASNDPVSTFVAQLIVEEVAFVAVSGGVITAARWAKRLKWIARILRTSKIKSVTRNINRVIKGLRKRLGKSIQYLKKGNYDDAYRDFKRLTKGRDINIGTDGVINSTLKDGSTASLRVGGGGTEATVQINRASGGKAIKIRYQQ